jgi:hypothetical protein
MHKNPPVGKGILYELSAEFVRQSRAVIFQASYNFSLFLLGKKLSGIGVIM